MRRYSCFCGSIRKNRANCGYGCIPQAQNAYSIFRDGFPVGYVWLCSNLPGQTGVPAGSAHQNLSQLRTSSEDSSHCRERNPDATRERDTRCPYTWDSELPRLLHTPKRVSLIEVQYTRRQCTKANRRPARANPRRRRARARRTANFRLKVYLARRTTRFCSRQAPKASSRLPASRPRIR